jgi:hypothetical protein
VNDFLVVCLDSIGERLLEYLHQDDEVHGPLFPSLGDRGSCTFYQYRLGHSALERLLEMVTSACDRATAPTGATTSQTGGFERLRLRPHQEPTCSLGTRRDTSRRCGGLAPVPSASVLLHVDVRVRNRST